jgi:DNA-binding MarR family transcriptional regulator
MQPKKVPSPTGSRHRAVRSEQSIQRIIDDIRRIFRRVGTLSRRAEHVTGLTSPQLWALKVLWETGSIDVPTLARRMGLHPSTLGGVLERLVGKGLVEWRRPRRAGGLPRAAVTRDGEYFASRAPAVAQVLLLDGLKRLSVDGLASVAAGTQRLVHMLGAEETPAQLLFSDEVNLQPVRRTRRARTAPGPQGSSS